MAPQNFVGSDRFLDTPLPRNEDTAPYRSASIGQGATETEPRIKIVADPSQNALLIMASEPDYRRVERVLLNLDVLPNQVLIEATIAEVSLTDELRFGVGGSSRTGPAALGRLLRPSHRGRRLGLSRVLLRRAGGGGQVTLNALNDLTRVNVLASPSLMVLDRRTAVLQIGDQVPITTQSAQSVLTPGAPVVNSVAYKDTGVILSVTPRINESGRVLLDIEQEVSTVSRDQQLQHRLADLRETEGQDDGRRQQRREHHPRRPHPGPHHRQRDAGSGARGHPDHRQGVQG